MFKRFPILFFAGFLFIKPLAALSPKPPSEYTSRHYQVDSLRNKVHRLKSRGATEKQIIGLKQKVSVSLEHLNSHQQQLLIIKSELEKIQEELNSLQGLPASH